MALIFDPYHSCFTLSVLFSLWMDLVTGLITLNPQYPVVGQTVILNATRVTEQILSFTWYKGSGTVSTGLILTYYPALPTPQVPGAIYFDRANGLPDGSLQIRDLRITDKGEYRTQITVQSGTLPQETVYLFVYELLQTPTLTISSSRPLPGGNVTFHCDARNQTVSNYTFYRNQQRISCSPPHVICNYSSPYLSFYPITESDSGNYTCVIMNPLNSNTSNVIVIEKVSNVMLTSNTSGPVHVNKDSVSLTCSARGTNVYYSWSMRGTALPSDPRYHLNQNNSSLIISPVTEADNGTFTCTASNFLNSATSSSPFSLSWYPNGTIQCLADFIKDIVDLQCSWPGGNPAVELHLQFNNISMSGTNYIVSSIHQKDITLNTFLYCRGSQEKLIQTCYLDIDTPKSVGFNNDSTTEGILGNSVTLTLNLQNRGERQTNLYHVLPANFTWYKLATDPSPLPSEKPFFVISTAYQSSLTINPVTKEVGGRYMCIATNPLGNTSFVFYLNVTEAPPSGLSGGAIAGIVIGVLVSVAIIAIMVFFIIKATKGSTNGERGPFTGHVYENTRSQSENTYSRTIPGTQQVEMSNSANPVPVYEQLMVKNEAVYNTIMPSYKK